jgi:VanZ family protein
MRQSILRYIPAPVTALAIWTLSSFSTLPLPDTGLQFFDKLLHATAYAALAFFVALMFTPHQWDGRTWKIFLLVVLISASYGGLDEFHQSFVPGRDTSFYDWLADLAGSCTGAGMFTMILKTQTTGSDPE